MSDRRPGSFGYKAGTGATFVQVPDNARIKSVFLLAGTASATVQVGTGDLVTVPAGIAFDDEVSGVLPGTDVTFAGNAAAWYVRWVDG